MKPLEVYVSTGDKEYSGTGRNQKVKKLVEPWSNYKSIPISLKWIPTEGSEMVIKSDYAELLGGYWQRFGRISRYFATWEEAGKSVAITTRHGNKAVALARNSNNGALLLLPDLDFSSPENFVKKKGEVLFSERYIQLCRGLIEEVIVIDRKIREGLEKTPEPEWAKAPDYSLKQEKKIREELLVVEAQLEKVQKKRRGKGCSR
jgi:hypothetical protein